MDEKNNDNFWSWLGRQPLSESVALDEDSQGGVWKHPDGKPCKASRKENCPFYKDEVSKSVQIDDLKVKSEVSKVMSVSSAGEMETIKRGGTPAGGKFENVSVDDLPTMKVGSTKSRWREMRNKLVAYVTNNKIGDGSYPLVDVDDKEAMKGFGPKYYSDGYMVSFQTTNGEGFNRGRKDLMMSDTDYDTLCDDLVAEGYKPHVGVFGGVPEISFKIDSKELAKKMMSKYNQVAMWDNKMGTKAANIAGKDGVSSSKVDDMFDRANILNLDYNWKENQVTKAK